MMETLVFGFLIVTTVITIAALFIQSARCMVYTLVLQATTIGFVQLMYCVVELFLDLSPEALADFFYAFAEWFVCAAVVPSIIYFGLARTTYSFIKPTIKGMNVIVFVCLLVLAHFALGLWLQSWFPSRMETFIFAILMFNISIATMVINRHAIKILIGLNMAENALFPLLVESPAIFVPFILVAVVFVNIVAVYVIIFAYQTYNTLLVTDWR